MSTSYVPESGLVRVLYATYFITKTGKVIWDNNDGRNYVAVP